MYQLFCILIALPLFASPTLGNSETWLAPPGRGQLEQDPTLIPKGKGLLFVPTMTGSLNEPSFLILQGGKPIREASPGTGVLLSPGYYEVLIGSGTDVQMTSRTVPIHEDMTTLVKPFWSGLVVNVIDEQRSTINESYELYWEDQQENYGIGFGVEEERGEAVKTWLLPPGVYSVVPVGQNISTTRKFSVRLEPGELVQRNLVVDTDNNDTFVGFYPPSPQGVLGQKIGSNWKTSLQLSGSTRLSTSQNATGEDRSVLALTTQVLGRSVYSTDRHFFNMGLTFEEEFTREVGDAAIDEFEVRATYIYRLSKWLGPYLRGVFNTRLFATKARFNPPRPLLIHWADGRRTRSDVEEFTLSSAFSPLDMRQGIGINSQVARSFPFTLDMRVGFGARQKYFAGAFDLNSTRTVARELSDEITTGLEALLILKLRPAQSLILDSEFDVIIPGRATADWEFNWENRLRLALSRLVNMDLVFDLRRERATRRLQSRQQVLVRFVYWL